MNPNMTLEYRKRLAGLYSALQQEDTRLKASEVNRIDADAKH